MEADPSPRTAELADHDARTLRHRLADRACTSSEVVHALLRRIDELNEQGPALRAIIETNPAALDIARRYDAERQAGEIRGPLHGVPVLLKDNIDTVDAMDTTAGSLALLGSRPRADAPLVTRLRRAGAVILAKANLSEWANFRSTHSSSGWSARGGLCVNPHALDRSAGGSSSGSASGVAAGLAPLAVGTETDGSITCPAALCGVVGLKPTVGLVSRSGLIPIAHSQDTAGPLARTVYDAALLLGVLAGTPDGDPAMADPKRRAYDDYTRFCVPDGLRGARIGLPRRQLWGYNRQADRLAEDAVRLLEAEGAEVVDPADLPTIDRLTECVEETVVLRTEFKADLEAYLATREPVGPRSLADLMEFNEKNADVELRHFGQEMFGYSDRTKGLDDPGYLAALHRCREMGRADGIDAALHTHGLDALVMPAYPPAWKIDLVGGDHVAGACATPAAVAGYPILTVPCGIAEGLPVGLAFMGTAWSEPTLIRLGYAFEQALGLRLRPAYRPPQVG